MMPIHTTHFVEYGLGAAPPPINEEVRTYRRGSLERAALEETLSEMSGARPELPLMIAGKTVVTGRMEPAVMPHDHQHVLADAHVASPVEVKMAIEAAVDAAKDWSSWPWQQRAAVFLKAADLLAGPWRARLNAATMLGQSKTVHQAEIDAAAELVDFWRFNVHFMLRLYAEQPISSPGVWNRMDYRPLEGFVYAATPFNFTAIAGNLPSAPALMGNTVVWKPAATAKLSAHLILQILREAGLPDGVINLVYGDGAEIAQVVLGDDRLAGVHFTGSTSVFNSILGAVSERIGSYRNYPRVVGETGGKNFILAHSSADQAALATAIIRGAFEYQGQKCSAASRLYVPASLWPALKQHLLDEMATIKLGDVRDLSNFMGAVIDGKAFRRHAAVFDAARAGPRTTILAGGKTAGERGWFVDPTLIETEDPNSSIMTEEFFGPIACAFVYPDNDFENIVRLIDQTGRYALTGAIFAQDRRKVSQAMHGLRQAAGNVYINDKPTGAVVGQQPFGGARGSGTNDKAGSLWNLARWTSPRAVKETFAPPADYRYPFME